MNNPTSAENTEVSGNWIFFNIYQRNYNNYFFRSKINLQHNNGNKTNNPPIASDIIDLSTTEILDDNTMSGLIGLQSSMLKHSQASLSSDQDYIPFAKDICGRYIVLYTFIARDENDVSVERGEFVTGMFSV